MDTKKGAFSSLLFAIVWLLTPVSHLAADSANAPAPGSANTINVEARIDLATVPGSASCHHIITEPGVYYLSGDLDVTKPTGINIQAEGVTLDLNGFEIRRVSDSGGHGILISLTADDCSVYNGSITGFAYGVRAFSENGVYRQLKASHCDFVGLAGGERWLIENCEAGNNPRIGISTGNNSVLRHFTVKNPSIQASTNGASRK